MKYLFLHSAREWTGTARAFAEAARGLAKRGHTVTVAVEPHTTAEQGISELASEPGRTLFAVVPLTLAGTWLGAAARLRSLARRVRADVIFVHTDREHLVAATALRLGSRAAVLRRVPAGRTLTLGRGGRVAAWLAPTLFVFTSEPDQHASRLPRRALGRAVAPLGVPEIEPVTLPEDAPETIVCVHDASSRSRAATAIRTVGMLAPRHPDVRLAVIGEGRYDDDLRMQAAALGVLARVGFLGDRADALRVIGDGRIGWVVADADTAAFALLDVMAAGRPALGAAGSVAERYVLHDITGMLVPAEDAYLTAATVAELLTNRERRERIGEAARARVRREYPLAGMIDGVERAAAAAVARRRRR